jgi:hypothetical protein
MKNAVRLLILLLLSTGCASLEEKDHIPYGLEIVEIKPDKGTALTKQNMLQLAQVYELAPFLFTKKIRIQSGVTPKSHPVLTLNTRFSEHPNKILSAWLHEELHWWSVKQKSKFILAIRDLKKVYRKVPRTKGNGPDSTYLHLLICYIEMEALSFYLGKKEAREVISSIMKKDKINPWIYYQILYKNFAIRKTIKKHKLLPSPLG